VSTAQSREALCVHCTVWSGTMFVLHSLEGHCVCNAQSRGALCLYSTVQKVTVCVLQSLEGHCLYTAESRVALCVCELHSLDRHWVLLKSL